MGNSWPQHRKSRMKFASNLCTDVADLLEVERDRHEEEDIPDMIILENQMNVSFAIKRKIAEIVTEILTYSLVQLEIDIGDP